jgi:hypothetical protein
MEAYRGNRGIAPLILHLGTAWRRVVNFIPRPLCPRESTPVLTDRYYKYSRTLL